jgi:hypothetical protein
MQRRLQNLLALGLVAFYAAAVTLSHGLHEWGGCEDCVASHSSAEGGSHAHGDCRCDHSSAERQANAASCEPVVAFRDAGSRGHDPTKCAACALIGKLKSSSAETPAEFVFAPATVRLRAVNRATPRTVAAIVPPARGPPVAPATCFVG